MARTRPRREKIAIGFMVLWLVFWTAGILIVLYGLVMAAGRGHLGGMAVMGVWLVAAAYGLYAGARKLRQLLTMGEGQRAGTPNQRWSDGMTGGPEP